MSDKIEHLLTAESVRAMLGGISEMSLHRHLRGNSGFPEPIRVNRIRYWRYSELDAWVARQPRERQHTPAA